MPVANLRHNFISVTSSSVLNTEMSSARSWMRCHTHTHIHVHVYATHTDTHIHTHSHATHT